MGKIVILDENTANKIAAGEVVERPSSVVKEMVENSIDAGATSVSVEIKNGGISYIKITDNGTGIDDDDVEIAFERHSTSKIRKAEDLEEIKTMGFRGEALSSISSVSKVELQTRIQDKDYGIKVLVEGGTLKSIERAGCPKGTTFIIRDLFYNTPARYKFLKKDSSEAAFVSDTLMKLALAMPEISFKFISSNSTQIHTPGNGDLKSTIYSLFGKNIAESLVEINSRNDNLAISGFIGKPEIARGNRNHQFIFMNNRCIKSKVVNSACEEAFKTILMKGKYAFAVIKLEIKPQLVDVNVHPAKIEVRFWDEQQVFRSVYGSIKNAIDTKMFETESNRVLLENIAEHPVKETLIIENKLDGVLDDKEVIKINSLDFSSETIKIVEESDLVVHQKDEKKHFQEIKYDLPQNIEQQVLKINQVNESMASIEQKETTDLSEPKCKSEKLSSNTIQSIRQEDLKLINHRILGQLFNTFVLVEYNNSLFFIDQHAAHERLIYDKLVKSFSERQIFTEMLAIPITMVFTATEWEIFKKNVEFFNKLGFESEEFGHNSVILRGIPSELSVELAKITFLDIIDKLESRGNELTADSAKVSEILYDVACKIAVKGGQKLHDAEIEALLMDLAGKKGLLTCPHGRPVIFSMDRHEIDKKFKRII